MESSEGSAGAGGSILKITHTYDWQVGDGCWQETQLLFLQASPQGCLSILIIWIPHEWWRECKEEEQHLFVLILELIFHDFHNILLTISVSLIQCEKGLHKGMDPRIQESFRSKVEADYHVQLEFPSPLIICPTHTQSGTVLPSKHSSHYIIVCSNCKLCEGRDSICLAEQPAQAIK